MRTFEFFTLEVSFFFFMKVIFFFRKVNVNYMEFGKQRTVKTINIHFLPSQIITINNNMYSCIYFLFIFMYFCFIVHSFISFLPLFLHL